MLVAILAAGASRRLGRPKQLVKLDGEPLLRRQCMNAIEAKVGPVAVILGCHANECAKSIGNLSITSHFNDGWEEGLASSIRLAVLAAQDVEASGLLLVHADQYRVTAGDLCSLFIAWSESRTHTCGASYGDDVGPPVIFPQQHFGKLMQLHGDVGGRRVLANLPGDELLRVPLPNAFHDLDTPWQLAVIAGE